MYHYSEKNSNYDNVDTENKREKICRDNDIFDDLEIVNEKQLMLPIDVEIREYISLPIYKFYDNPLMFWKNEATKFSILSKISRSLFGIMSTSA